MNMKIKRIFLVMLLCTLWLTGFAQKVIKVPLRTRLVNL